MNPTTKAAYVPPCPNLGPEPMPGPSYVPLILGLLALLLIALLLNFRSVMRLARRFRRGDRLRAAGLAGQGLPGVLPESPRAQWILWSRAVRAALVERFGPAWRAKTTEEIAAEPALTDLLGAERTTMLIRALFEADRARFADPSLPEPPPPLPYLDLIEALALDQK